MTHFFFQAEDGIRDGHVTGVQTCALPISPPSPTSSPLAITDTQRRSHPRQPSSHSRRVSYAGSVTSSRCQRARRHSSLPGAPSRSEERRVGKECRSRLSSYKNKGKNGHESRTIKIESPAIHRLI